MTCRNNEYTLSQKLRRNPPNTARPCLNNCDILVSHGSGAKHRTSNPPTSIPNNPEHIMNARLAQDDLDAIRAVAVAIVVNHPAAAWAYETTTITLDQALELAADPRGFWPRFHGVDRAMFWRWCERQGVPQCGCPSRHGWRCSNQSGPAGLWLDDFIRLDGAACASCAEVCA